MAQRMRFGIFLAPFHKPGINPTLALEQDLNLVEWLDRCDYDEVWFGEHHSAGSEISASPELMIATAAARTRRIRLGSGVVSVSYHNPLWVAERMVQLDHLTRGRAMLGVGPGSLPTDATMIGLSQKDTRGLLADGLDIITRLIRTEEPVNFENERWVLKDARLHLRPYSDFDIATAAVASPTGPKLAGKYGTGLLSIGATTAAGFDALALHWDVLEEEAKHYGQTVDRSKWRLVGLCHIAETAEQARRRRGVRHRALVPLFPGDRRLPADGDARRQRARDDRLHQRYRLWRHRHARDVPCPDRPAVEAIEWRLWRLSAAGP